MDQWITLLRCDMPSLQSLVMFPLAAAHSFMVTNPWVRRAKSSICALKHQGDVLLDPVAYQLRHHGVRFLDHATYHLDHAAYQLRVLWNRLSRMTMDEAFSCVRSNARAALDYVVRRSSAAFVMVYAKPCMLQVCRVMLQQLCLA